MYKATLNVFKKIGDITWKVVEGTGTVFCTIFNCTTAARLKGAFKSGFEGFKSLFESCVEKCGDDETAEVAPICTVEEIDVDVYSNGVPYAGSACNAECLGLHVVENEQCGLEEWAKARNTKFY